MSSTQDALSFAQWFLMCCGIPLFAGAIMAWLVSPLGGFTDLVRSRLALVFSILCIGLLFVVARWDGRHSLPTDGLGTVISMGIASAFGLAFALSRVRLASKWDKIAGMLIALVHLVVLAGVLMSDN